MDDGCFIIFDCESCPHRLAVDRAAIRSGISPVGLNTNPRREVLSCSCVFIILLWHLLALHT